MENKVKVICHMYLTIDGKIETSIKNYPDHETSGEIYDEYTFKTSNAWGCGRETFEYLSDKNVDLTKFEPYLGKKEDYIEKDDIYCFYFDRKGKLFFKDKYNDYYDKKSRFIEVITESVDPRFITYLKSKGICYMFAGKDDLDLNLFLDKLSLLGIKIFMLCGGPQLNSLFIAKDLVDEISLVICPGIQGGRKELTFVGGEDISSFPKMFKIKDVKILKDDTLHIFYKK